MKEYDESRMNSMLRILLKSILLLFILYWIIFSLLIVIVGKLSMLFLAVPMFLLGVYLFYKNRIVRLKSADSQSIIVQDGKKEITLYKEDILHVLKLVRFTFSKRFLLVISLAHKRFKVKRYLMFNEPAIDLIGKLKKIEGINLRNFE